MNQPVMAQGFLTLSFRPRGAGRFAGAAFLLFWLAGWAAGEAFALAFIIKGVHSLLTGRAPLAPTLAVGCFLLVWLTFWTLGGILAIRELLRLLWAEDRLALDHETLTRTHRLGPFVFRRQLTRQEIRRVYLQQTKLLALTGDGVVDLTDLGTPAERAEAATQLRAELDLPDDPGLPGCAALPAAWQEIVGPRGESLLVPNLRTRRQQALVVAIITTACWTVAAALARASLREPTLWALTAMFGVAAIWLTRQTVWLRRGRKEWRLERGRLVWQRRLGLDVAELADARALELIESTDSDGDRHYELRAIELSAPASSVAGWPSGWTGQGRAIAFAAACHSELARNLKLLVGQIPEIPRQARNDKSTIFCGILQMRSPCRAG
jgi:hypothetical protein